MNVSLLELIGKNFGRPNCTSEQINADFMVLRALEIGMRANNVDGQGSSLLRHAKSPIDIDEFKAVGKNRYVG